MGNSFDVRLERLTGTGVRRLPLRSASQELPGQGGITPSLQEEIRKRGTFYLETFGCQMNEHDSEKVAGVLLARGYRQVETIDAADVILYNTCSIREKAAQKVFSRLGEYRAKQSEGKIIGVLGCVAQQEGEGIFESAPRVSRV